MKNSEQKLLDIIKTIISNCGFTSLQYTQFTVDWIEKYEQKFKQSYDINTFLTDLYYELEIIMEFINPNLLEFKFFQILYNLFEIYNVNLNKKEERL